MEKTVQNILGKSGVDFDEDDLDYYGMEDEFFAEFSSDEEIFPARNDDVAPVQNPPQVRVPVKVKFPRSFVVMKLFRERTHRY